MHLSALGLAENMTMTRHYLYISDKTPLGVIKAALERLDRIAPLMTDPSFYSEIWNKGNGVDFFNLYCFSNLFSNSDGNHQNHIIIHTSSPIKGMIHIILENNNRIFLGQSV